MVDDVAREPTKATALPPRRWQRGGVVNLIRVYAWGGENAVGRRSTLGGVSVDRVTEYCVEATTVREQATVHEPCRHTAHVINNPHTVPRQ